MSHLPPITIKEAIKITGYCRRSILYWLEGDNPPPHFRMGRGICFWRDEFTEWARKNGKIKRKDRA